MFIWLLSVLFAVYCVLKHGLWVCKRPCLACQEYSFKMQYVDCQIVSV